MLSAKATPREQADPAVIVQIPLSELYPFPDEESKWAFWAEDIWQNRHGVSALPLYEQVCDYLRGRDCFVLTTNADAQFAKAGFDRKRLHALQGDYGYLQCAAGCHEAVYPNKDIVDAIRLDTRGGDRVRISDDALVPRCPECGGPVVPWLRSDGVFAQDGEWLAAQARYESWLEDAVSEGGLVLLELGVGFSTPGAIRFPFERLSAEHGCTLVRMNADASAGASGTDSMVVVAGDISVSWPLVAGWPERSQTRASGV